MITGNWKRYAPSHFIPIIRTHNKPIEYEFGINCPGARSILNRIALHTYIHEIVFSYRLQDEECWVKQ